MAFPDPNPTPPERKRKKSTNSELRRDKGFDDCDADERRLTPVSSDSEIELRILKESVGKNTLEGMLDSPDECSDVDSVAFNEAENAKRAVRFLKEIRQVKNERSPSKRSIRSDHSVGQPSSEMVDSESRVNVDFDDENQIDAWESLDAELPKYIGRFEVIRLIGQGGFAKVFLCRDESLNRLVAIKIPKPHALLSHESRRRFQREAHAAAMLSHPAIVPVFEHDTTGPVTFIVSSYCEGPSLAEWIEDHRDRITPRHAAQIVARIAEAVEHAHQRGVIHRDLKPGNVLIENEFAMDNSHGFYSPNDPLDISHRVRITDFGLAKYTDDQQLASLTAEGAVIGTPAYMAPEQARGEKSVWAQADVFSLGTILYELLSGVIPFKRKSNVATLRAIEDYTPKSLRRLNSDIHKDLEAICMTCLEKQPSRRYPSAFDLYQDLNNWLAGRPIVARAPTTLDRLRAWYRRNPGLAASLAFAFLCLVVGLTFSLWQHNKAQNNLKVSTTQTERAERNVAAMESIIDDMLNEYMGMLDSNETISDRQVGMLSKMLVAHKELIDKEAENLQITPDTFNTYRRLSQFYRKTGKHTDALNTCDQAIEFWNVIDDKTQKVAFRKNLIEVTLERASVQLAMEFHSDARQTLLDCNRLLNLGRDHLPERLVDSYSFLINRNLGLNLLAETRSTEALAYLELARDRALARLSRDPESEQFQTDYLLTLQDLGECAKGLGHYRESSEYQQKAYQLLNKVAKNSKSDLRFRKAYLLSDLGLGYLISNQQEKVEDKYLASIQILRTLREEDISNAVVHHRLVHTYQRLGDFYLRQEEFKKCKASFEKGRSAAEDLSDPMQRTTALVNLDSDLGKLCLEHLDQYELAQQYLENAIESGELGVIEFSHSSKIRHALMESYAALGILVEENDSDLAMRYKQHASKHANVSLARHPDQERVKSGALRRARDLSQFAFEMDRIEIAVEAFVNFAEHAPDEPTVQYEAARYLAGLKLDIDGQIKKELATSVTEMAERLAIEKTIETRVVGLLRRAIALGFDDQSLLDTHPQWSGLRETESFQAIRNSLTE